MEPACRIYYAAHACCFCLGYERMGFMPGEIPVSAEISVFSALRAVYQNGNDPTLERMGDFEVVKGTQANGSSIEIQRASAVMEERVGGASFTAFIGYTAVTPEDIVEPDYLTRKYLITDGKAVQVLADERFAFRELGLGEQADIVAIIEGSKFE